MGSFSLHWAQRPFFLASCLLVCPQSRLFSFWLASWSALSLTRGFGAEVDLLGDLGFGSFAVFFLFAVGFFLLGLARSFCSIWKER